MLNKNFKRLAIASTLTFSLLCTPILVPSVNAEVVYITGYNVGDFDTTLKTSKWTPVGYYGFNAPTVSTGKYSVTYGGNTFQADGVTLNASTYGYRAYSTNLSLKPNTPYIMKGYVKATNVQKNPAHADGTSPFGFSIKEDMYGYPSNQLTNTTHLLESGTNSTDGWELIEFQFISAPSGNTILDCHIGSYACDSKGKVEFAGLTLKENSRYRKVSHSDFAAAVPVAQMINKNVSGPELDAWGLKMNNMTKKYKQLTGKNLGVSQIFMHDNKYLDTYYKVPYAYAGAPSHFNTDASNFTLQYAFNNNAVEHGDIHEVAHTYNTDYNRVWNFNDDVFCNVRAAYAVVENNTRVVCLGLEETYNDPYQGMEYLQRFADSWSEYKSSAYMKSRGYDLFSMCHVYLRMVYGDASQGLAPLGWDVFTEFFTNGANYNPTNKIYLDPYKNYSDDFKVFTNSLNIIAEIAGKSPQEIANYVPDNFYWNWYGDPINYPFKDWRY